MFFRISINFYQFSLTITFDATKHYYMPTSQIFTTFMGVSCKSFFLSLVVLHILLNQNVAILYSSLKMSFCHFPVFHARCSFYYYNLQFFCFFLSLFCTPIQVFFFCNNTLHTESWLLWLHSLVACLAVNFGLPTKILTIFHLSCLTCEVF